MIAIPAVAVGKHRVAGNSHIHDSLHSRHSGPGPLELHTHMHRILDEHTHSIHRHSTGSVPAETEASTYMDLNLLS